MSKIVKNRFAILLLSLTVTLSLIATNLIATEVVSASEQDAWYVTYLGGADTDYGEAIAVDSAGNSYMVGQTESTDFPVTTDAYQSDNAGGSYDLIYSKFDSSGSLAYSTYLGGSGGEDAYDIAVDSAGNTYIVGRTQSSDFPITLDAYQMSKSAGYDGFLSKFDSSGDLVYSTFFGGSAYEYAYDIALDNSGNIYVTGKTASTNYPVSSDAHQPNNAGNYDAFLTKFDPSGSLAYSTYLGGIDRDTAEGSVSVDSTGNVYITGYTVSTDFPVSSDAYQADNAGGDDAFLSKFDSSGSLTYSTYLGGSGDDYALGSVMDDTGNIYIAGDTISTDFPVSADAHQSTNAGGDDAFLSKFDSSGSLAYSTYIGGSNDEETCDIAIDGTGNAYITGRTESSDYPTTSDIYQTTKSGGYDSFLSKINTSGDLNYSTFVGGSGSEYTCNISVDSTGNAYITGRTNSANFPVTTDAYQPSNAGDYDVFFARRMASGSSPSYTGVSVSPSSQSVDNGANFDIDIDIETDTASRGWQLDVEFDADKMSANSVTEGSFLSDWAVANGGSTVPSGSVTIDNVNGIIEIPGYAITGAGTDGPTGTGTLCSISFTAKDDVDDYADIDLSNVVINDVDGTAIPGVTVTGGTVAIGSEPLPDLVVSDAYTTADTIDPTMYTVTYTIENIGQATASASTTSIVIGGGTPITIACPALDTGTSDTQTTSTQTLSGTADSVLITADSASEVIESNEGNNTVTTSYSYVEDQPGGDVPVGGTTQTFLELQLPDPVNWTPLDIGENLANRSMTVISNTDWQVTVSGSNEGFMTKYDGTTYDMDFQLHDALHLDSENNITMTGSTQVLADGTPAEQPLDDSGDARDVTFVQQVYYADPVLPSGYIYQVIVTFTASPTI